MMSSLPLFDPLRRLSRAAVMTWFWHHFRYAPQSYRLDERWHHPGYITAGQAAQFHRPPLNDQPYSDPPIDESTPTFQEIVTVRVWDKLVYLLPQQTTVEQYDLVQEIAYPTRSEIAFSADSAFARPLNVTTHKVVVFGVELWGGKQALEDWINLHYRCEPPTEIEYRPMPGTIVLPPPFKLASPIAGIPLVVTDPFNAPRPYANGLHEGVDLRAIDSNGSPMPILAAYDGEVVWDQDVIGGAYGVFVFLKHMHENQEWHTEYAHLSRNDVAVGQRVSAGQRIGVAGATGTTAIHLHLNLRKIGGGLSGYARPDVVDPAPYLPLTSLPPPPPPPPPPAAWSGALGIGTARSGDFTAQEIDALRRAKLAAFKFKTDENRDKSLVAKSLGIPVENIIQRFHYPPGSLPSPHDFVVLFRTPMGEQWQNGVRKFEITNEPNVEYVAMGARNFAVWLRTVYDLLLAAWPGIELVSPGLSPHLTGDASDTDAWMHELDAIGVLRDSAFIGVHSYAPTSDLLTDSAQGFFFTRYAGLLKTGQQMALTEWSVNQAIETDEQKARGYLAALSKLPSYVASVYIFALSSDDSFYDERRETWVRNRGTVMTVTPDIIGAR